jgi:uncharacterized protein (TIGR03086 family)
MLQSMSDVAVRYQRVAGRFDETVKAVPADKWDAPAPCEGWTARDIVRHLTSWMPGMFLGQQEPTGPSVDDDPVAAWSHLHERLTALTQEADFDTRMAGDRKLADALSSFGIGDIFLHTWDLARATGLPEELDPEIVHEMYEGMSSIDDEMLRGSGQFGPRVEVPDDASEQDKLIAFIGRRP